MRMFVRLLTLRNDDDYTVVDHNVFKTQFFLIHYWLLPSSELCRIAHYLGLRHVLLVFDLSPHLAVAHNIDTVGHS